MGRGGVMRRNGPAVIGLLPGTPGVYRFRDAGGRVLYIGRATTLRSRVASYWSDLRDRKHSGHAACPVPPANWPRPRTLGASSCSAMPNSPQALHGAANARLGLLERTGLVPSLGVRWPGAGADVLSSGAATSWRRRTGASRRGLARCAG